MRLLLPTRKICLCSLFLIFCVGGGFVVWNQRYRTPIEEQLPFILFLAAFFWAAIYLSGREIQNGPLVSLYGERRKFQVPLQTEQTVKIGPFHRMEGHFLLIKMKFEMPEDEAHKMSSFRLYKPKKNPCDRILGWVEIRAGDTTGEGEVLSQANIDWSLQEESEAEEIGLIYKLEILIPERNYDAHYLIISPLKMSKSFSKVADDMVLDNLSVDLTLGVGFKFGKLHTKVWPSLQSSEVVI